MLNSIRLLIEACDRLSINYEFQSSNKNVVKVIVNNYPHYFTNYSTPLLSQSMAEILKDKDYLYQLLNDVVNMPLTSSFLSPYVEEKYSQYLSYKSTKAITTYIENEYSFPVFVKRNRGSGGNNVFKCENKREILEALESIFDVNSKHYDYIALAQQSISITKEYRVVCLNRKILLVYEKDISNANFAGNYSPLHYDNALAVEINSQDIIDEINKFIAPIFEKIDITYCGLDIVKDNQNKYWLIEANSHPNFSIFTRDNGDEKVVELFAQILNYLHSIC